MLGFFDDSLFKQPIAFKGHYFLVIHKTLKSNYAACVQHKRQNLHHKKPFYFQTVHIIKER